MVKVMKSSSASRGTGQGRGAHCCKDAGHAASQSSKSMSVMGRVHQLTYSHAGCIHLMGV